MLKIIQVLVLVFVSVHGDICRGTCKYRREYGMKSVDCFNKDLKQIPRCLQHDIEVLDMSYNRIRKIVKEDLSNYSNIKFLYLSENMITEIEEEALEDKTDLQSLDISYNSFTSLPAVIFQLPSLRSLYLSQNQNINIVNEIENSRPITSPLSYLDIGFNELTRLPNLGILTSLIKYNISGNFNVKLSTDDFAGLCNLEILVNNNITAIFDDPCECSNLENWLTRRKVKFSGIGCEKKDCPYKIPDDNLEMFNRCKEMHAEIVAKSRIYKIIIPSVAVAMVVLLVIALYFCIRRRKQKKRHLKKIYITDETKFIGDH